MKSYKPHWLHLTREMPIKLMVGSDWQFPIHLCHQGLCLLYNGVFRCSCIKFSRQDKKHVLMPRMSSTTKYRHGHFNNASSFHNKVGKLSSFLFFLLLHTLNSTNLLFIIFIFTLFLIFGIFSGFSNTLLSSSSVKLFSIYSPLFECTMPFTPWIAISVFIISNCCIVGISYPHHSLH